MATMLSTMHMRHALDENGAEIEVREEFTGLFLTYDIILSTFTEMWILTDRLYLFSGPEPFAHRLEPRSSQTTKLLAESSDYIEAVAAV